MPNVLFVSVNKSFRPWFSLSQLEPCAERAWAVTVSKAETCDRLVAMFHGDPVGAWRIRGAFSTDEVYMQGDRKRARTGFSLGDPLPILREYREQAPGMRHGVATAEIDVDALPSERVADDA